MERMIEVREKEGEKSVRCPGCGESWIKIDEAQARGERDITCENKACSFSAAFNVDAKVAEAQKEIEAEKNKKKGAVAK